MAEKRVVLVTGVAGFWGSRVAIRLVTERGYHVVGLGIERPAQEIGGLDFVQADVRNPLLGELIKAEAVDTVCHLDLVESGRPSNSAFDLNVMGTTKLLEACAEAGVSKMVLKSSTAVYGARPSNPAFLTEDHPLRGSERYGYARDLREIETFCRGYSRQMPDIALTTLRFANIIGPTVSSPMVRFLREPWMPSLLGFDPMMQLIHEDDVVAALVHAVRNDTPGVFNVGAWDALPLSKVRGLAGKPPVAILHPFVYWGVGSRASRALRLDRLLPIDPDYLRYPWVGDLRQMEEVLDFAPRFTAEEAVHEVAEQNRMRRYLSESEYLAQSGERLRSVIEQRQEVRARQNEVVSSAGEGEGDE
jgi:UDP-glucose 4-epimerase